jgi:uncharacterized protein YndB with AHSA1/START domain
MDRKIRALATPRARGPQEAARRRGVRGRIHDRQARAVAAKLGYRGGTDTMARTEFIYVTYIRTTPEKLWEALTSWEFTKQYWAQLESDWRPGKLTFAEGRTADAGEVLESDPPRRLVLKWRNEFRPELKADGYALYVRGRARGRGGEAHRDPRGGAPPQADRGRLARLATRAVEPEEPARDRQRSAADRSAAEVMLTPIASRRIGARLRRAVRRDGRHAQQRTRTKDSQPMPAR